MSEPANMTIPTKHEESQRPTFAVRNGEGSFAVLSFPIAYLYIWGFWNGRSITSSIVIVAVFTVLFLAAGEIWNRHRQASAESRIWLGGTVLLLVAIVFAPGRVWEGREFLFLHAFAIYWLMARSGLLARGSTSCFVWYDALNAVLLIPLRNFTLRVKILWYMLTQGTRPGKNAAWAICAAVLGIGLFAYVMIQLSDADAGFARVLGQIFAGLTVNGMKPFLYRLVVSIPVGAYLTGMLLGMVRAKRNEFADEADSIDAGMKKLRKVPVAVWTAIIAVFCVLYGVFFAVQGSYLFGALAGRLPAEFTVAQYARQGFFELCRVMAVNFSLLWLTTHSTNRTLSRTALTILLGESILLGVTAMSKLYMYIDTFGFTPLRLQSSWLVLVLLAGCVCAIVSVWTRKKTFRVWAIFSAAALLLTCFY